MTRDGREEEMGIEDAAIGWRDGFEKFRFGEMNFDGEAGNVVGSGEILERNSGDNALMEKAGSGQRRMAGTGIEKGGATGPGGILQ